MCIVDVNKNVNKARTPFSYYDLHTLTEIDPLTFLLISVIEQVNKLRQYFLMYKSS